MKATQNPTLGSCRGAGIEGSARRNAVAQGLGDSKTLWNRSPRLQGPLEETAKGQGKSYSAARLRRRAVKLAMQSFAL